MRVEHLVGEELGLAHQRRRADRRRCARRRRSRSTSSTPKASSTATRCSREVVSEVEMPTVSSSASRRCTPRSRAASTTAAAPPGTPTVTVSKNCSCTHVGAGLAQRGGQHRGVAVGAPRDRPQPLGAVVDGVHRRHHGQQHLRGADVGGRLVAADVLLAGLQREPVRRAALGVDRDADQPAGQVPLEAGAHGHEAGVRAAVEQRDAEALRGADDHVGAHRARATPAGSARAGRRRRRPCRRARAPPR